MLICCHLRLLICRFCSGGKRLNLHEDDENTLKIMYTDTNPIVIPSVNGVLVLHLKCPNFISESFLNPENKILLRKQ